MSTAVLIRRREAVQNIFYGSLVLLVAAGAIASYVDRGLQSRSFPWGLCFCLNTLCGSSLAAGGFVLALFSVFTAIRSDLLTRTPLLIALFGHVVAVLGGLAETPNGVARQLFAGWSANNFLGGAAWSLLIYFFAILSEFIGSKSFPARVIRRSKLPLITLSACLACFHQVAANQSVVSSGGIFSRLWVGPFFPVLLLLSDLSAVLALLIMASYLLSRRRHSPLVWPVPVILTQVLGFALLLHLTLRLAEMLGQPRAYSLVPREFVMFVIEMAPLLGAIFVSRFTDEARREKSQYLMGFLTMAWFLANRLNTGITVAELAQGRRYFPQWTEIAVAYSIAAIGICSFGFIVKRFNQAHHHTSPMGTRS